MQVCFLIIFMTSLSFCRFRFITKMWVYHFVGLNSRPSLEMNFVVKLQVTLHQFSTIRALLLSIFSQGMQYVWHIASKIQTRTYSKFEYKNKWEEPVWDYCKVSHVVFIILVVQIFCLKCIYHFAGLKFSYLSFCRFTLLNIQKIVSFS